MDCVLMVLVIYEIRWDDFDEDGERGGGLQMYVALSPEPEKYSTYFFY